MKIKMSTALLALVSGMLAFQTQAAVVERESSDHASFASRQDGERDTFLEISQALKESDAPEVRTLSFKLEDISSERFLERVDKKKHDDDGPREHPPVSTVPEPSSLALMGTSLAMLGFIRRRKTKQT